MDHSQKSLFTSFEPILLEAVISIPDWARVNGVFKCRVTYSQQLEKIAFEPYAFRFVHSLRLVDADLIDYTFKYADRSFIEALFLKRDKCSDILMVKNGCLTDTSYANVALFDGEKWLTPAKPLLPGTCRARLLAEGQIHEAEIRRDELHLFKKIRLFNAMTGWKRGSEISCDQLF